MATVKDKTVDSMDHESDPICQFLHSYTYEPFSHSPYYVPQTNTKAAKTNMQRGTHRPLWFIPSASTSFVEQKPCSLLEYPQNAHISPITQTQVTVLPWQQQLLIPRKAWSVIQVSPGWDPKWDFFFSLQRGAKYVSSIGLFPCMMQLTCSLAKSQGIYLKSEP